MDQFPIIAVRSYSDLITALRAVKNYLQLSNEFVEDLAGLTRGHWDKVAGACPTKKAGPVVFLMLCSALLAIELHVHPDPAAAERVSHRWQKRDEHQVRTQPARMNKALLARAAAELGRRGAIAAAKARRRERRNGHAAGR